MYITEGIVSKKKNSKLKITLYTLLCIFILIFLLYTFFMYIYLNSVAANETIATYYTENTLLKNFKKNYKSAKEKHYILQNSNEIKQQQCNNIINIYSSQTEKTVFLTFDDGPSKNVTPLILDLLEKENIKATFFVLGTNVEKNPNILLQTYKSGHYIANHGYSHIYKEIYNTPENIINDYNLCEQAIQKALNKPYYSSKVYRFPGGSTGGIYHDNKTIGKDLLKQNNIAYLDWNALTRDAEGYPTKESILKNLEETTANKNTIVLLMHDSSSKILTYDTLPSVINYLKEQGYTFKTIYDIL